MTGGRGEERVHARVSQRVGHLLDTSKGRGKKLALRAVFFAHDRDIGYIVSYRERLAITRCHVTQTLWQLCRYRRTDR